MKPKSSISLPTKLLWIVIGLFLTIISTFIEVMITNQPWYWYRQGIAVHSLGVTYQIGAVLLTACMGGKNAGAIAQVAYLSLGLSGMAVFAQGGGWSYLKEPSFGYLLGFVPGAWACGWLVWRSQATVEWLAIASTFGLGIIHLTGLIYLGGLYLLKIAPVNSLGNLELMVTIYTLNALPGHLLVTCSVALIAYLLRRILFY